MKSWKRVALLLVVLTVVTAAVAQGQPAPVDEFRPLTAEDMQEQIPAANLVFAAYATVWLVFSFYLFTLWRRVSSVESELRAVAAKFEGRRG
jgi:CcmD family protein